MTFLQWVGSYCIPFQSCARILGAWYIPYSMPHSKSDLTNYNEGVCLWICFHIVVAALCVFSSSCFKYQFKWKWIISGGSDYSFATQSFLLHSGERRCVSIEIVDDTIVEQHTESVRVQFRTRPSYGNAATYYNTIISIRDNDGEWCTRRMHVANFGCRVSNVYSDDRYNWTVDFSIFLV